MLLAQSQLDAAIPIDRVPTDAIHIARRHPLAAPPTASAAVEPERGLELHAALRRRVSGVALPRYVIDPPEGTGKVEVRDWFSQQS